MSAQTLANTLVANFASYNLAITNVTVLGASSSVGVPPLGTPPPTGLTGTATGTPGGPAPPKGSAYQDWAPALISCVIGLAIGVAVIIIALIKRKTANTNNNQKMVIGLCVMLLCGPNGTYSLTRTYANCRILLPDIDYRLYWEVRSDISVSLARPLASMLTVVWNLIFLKKFPSTFECMFAYARNFSG